MFWLHWDFVVAHGLISSFDKWWLLSSRGARASHWVASLVAEYGF